MRITPYDPIHDKLSVVGDNNHDYNLLTSLDASGSFSITTQRPELLTLDDWNWIINFPAYKLDLDVRNISPFFLSLLSYLYLSPL